MTAVEFVPDGECVSCHHGTNELGLPYLPVFRSSSYLSKDYTILFMNSLFTAKRYDVDGDLFEIITSEETRYFLQAATPDERKDWIQAVQAVSKSGK